MKADNRAGSQGTMVTRRAVIQAGAGLALAGCSSGLVRSAVAARATISKAASTNHDDPHLHLMVDDEELETVEGLQRELNRPAKHASPVVVADRPWEGE